MSSRWRAGGARGTGRAPRALPASPGGAARRAAMAATAALEALVRSGSKCVAVGRNYAAHARELGNAPPAAPFFFFKVRAAASAASARAAAHALARSLTLSGAPRAKPRSSYTWDRIEVPPDVEELHHEVELGVIIGSTMRDVPAPAAMGHVAGYFAAVDVTARCIQAKAKAKGLPWSAAKGYDTFCALSACVPRLATGEQGRGVADGDIDALELHLSVDGEERQRGTCEQMTWKVPELLAHISTVCTLGAGDTVLTGTPEGVGPMRPGQRVAMGITGLLDAEFHVVRRESPPSA